MWIQEWINNRLGVPNTVNIQVYEDFAKEVEGRIGEVLYQIVVESSWETDLTLEGEKRKLVFICNRLRPLINELKGQALKGESNE